MTIAVPTLEALKKEGEAGRRKITQYTRYGTLVLALVQGFGIAIALESQRELVIDPGMLFRLTTVMTLVTGTLFLMWLGEQITERGLGNGISSRGSRPCRRPTDRAACGRAPARC